MATATKQHTSKAKFKPLAEHYFINLGWTIKAISDFLGISERTIGTWKADGKWEESRDLIVAAPHKIKTVLLEELKKIANGQESKVNADALAKVAKAIESLDDKISIPVVISVFQEFDLWMVDQDPKIALQFTEYHRKFILHKINVDG